MSIDLTAQLPFLVVVIFLIIRIIDSYKKGFVKEICGLIATIFSTVIVMVLSFAYRQYVGESKLTAWVSLALVVLLVILYRLIDVIIGALKIFSKVPVLSTIDKVLGPVFALLETIVLVWGAFCVAIVLDHGVYHDVIMNCVRNNVVMYYLYQYNYLQVLVIKYGDVFAKGIADIISEFNLIPDLPTDL